MTDEKYQAFLRRFDIELCPKCGCLMEPNDVTGVVECLECFLRDVDTDEAIGLIGG